MARKRLPASGHAVVPDAESGNMDFTWYKHQKRAARETQTVSDTVDSITTAVAAHCALIEYPDNKDYIIWLRTPFAGTITRTTVKSSSGTCTLTVKINTSAVGGSAHSVSSTEESIERSSSNTFAAGDDFRLTVASNSACVDLAVSIEYTRSDL